MILLLELHRDAISKEESDEIVFHPCGKGDSFNKERLLSVIGYSYCISTTAFIEITRFFLRGADLRGADLRGADLRGADLSRAKVQNVIFSQSVELSEDIKLDLKQRGAIFEDLLGDRSPTLERT